MLKDGYPRSSKAQGRQARAPEKPVGKYGCPDGVNHVSAVVRGVVKKALI
jgi:hypothetical protein